MLKTPSRFLLACAVLAWSSIALAQSLPPYNPVTDARLQNPEASNWLMYRGSYDSHGYSSLDQINRDNVDELRPVWSFSTGLREGHQAPPIVNDGYMYVSTPQNHIIALDARSGDMIWRYKIGRASCRETV